MAIESEVIVGKLKEEGIDEKLAIGISFETEEALNEWVGNAKTFTTKPKDILEYTEDELKKMADEGKVKALQALLDKTRAQAKTKTDPKATDPKLTESPELKAIQEQLASLMTEVKTTKEESQKAKFDSYIESKTKGFDPLEVSMLKSTLSVTSTNQEIDKAVSDYRALMVKRGLRSYSSESVSSKESGELDPSLSSAIKGFVSSKTQNKK